MLKATYKARKNNMEIKTIDIYAKEWFDKINGNSYFSAIITLNYGMENSITVGLPFQYGYGSHYIDMAKNKLKEMGIISIDENTPIWRYCRENGIILRHDIKQQCRKKDVIHYGEGGMYK